MSVAISVDPEESLPRKISHYEVIGRLATGGMAELFLAARVGPSGFHRSVVIKRILPHLARDPSFVTMFLDEARIAATVQHPNVVRVEELGREGDQLFMVMEYLAGESVAAVIRRLVGRGRTLPHELGVHIVAEACAGLHAAHELRGDDGVPLDIVHRDVSPQNVIVTYDGIIKILDFGIAKAAERLTKTDTGLVKGKFEYMSPEQVRGEPIDRTSDVFAMGVVLYEILSGRRLFRRANQAATLRAVLEHPILPPSELRAGLPPALDEICLRALSRSRRLRYPTAAALRGDLLKAIRGSDHEVLIEERLAALMNELFAEQADGKRQMLQRVERGGDLSGIVIEEATSDAELPLVPSTHDAETKALASRTEPSGRWRWALGGGLLVVLLGAGAWYGWGQLGARADQPLASLSPPTPSRPLTPAPTPTVQVTIRTEPAGAVVLVAGEQRLVTPGELSIPRGPTAVPVTIRHDGYRTVEQSITPDVDHQRLVVTLVPEPNEPAPVGAQPPEPAANRPRPPVRPPHRPRNPPTAPAGPGIPLWE